MAVRDKKTQKELDNYITTFKSTYPKIEIDRELFGVLEESLSSNTVIYLSRDKISVDVFSFDNDDRDVVYPITILTFYTSDDGFEKFNYSDIIEMMSSSIFLYFEKDIIISNFKSLYRNNNIEKLLK